MSIGRSASGAARRITSFGRVLLAVVLLAGLWFGTVKGVDRASRGADQKRVADRLAVARGFALSIRDWVDAGRSEAASLGHTVGASPAVGLSGAISSFVAQPKAFSRDAMVFSGNKVMAASGRFAALTGFVPRPCVRAG